MAYWYDVINVILIFGILAGSLNLLFGYAGQPSIAHAAMAGVGGYVAAYLAVRHGWALGPATVVAVIAATAVGGVVAMPALRLADEYLILLTLALSNIVQSITTSITTLGGTYGLPGVPSPSIGSFALASAGHWLPVLLVLFGVITWALWLVGRAQFGRVLKAIRDDELAARSLGKRTVRMKIVTFAATGGIAGFAGTLLVYYNNVAAPSEFDLNTSVSIVAMVMIGGAGNLLGSWVGAVVVMGTGPFLERVFHLSSQNAATGRLIIYGAALMAIVLLRPQGIVPERRRGSRTAPGVRVAALPHAVSANRKVEADGKGHANGDGNGGRVLVVDGISKAFAGLKAVRSASLTLPAERISGLIGPNGAGKSTMFNLMTGFIPADTGSVTLGAQELRGRTPEQVADSGMVRSFQDVRLFDRLTALENVLVGISGHPGEKIRNIFLRPRAVRAAEEAAQRTALERLAEVGLAEKSTALAGDLGYGEQKLLAIARVMGTGAQVLLLDEPTSGIDPEWLETVADVVRRLPERGHTVCVVEHNLDFLRRLGADCYFMEAGEVVAEGTLGTLMEDERLRTAYFGVGA